MLLKVGGLSHGLEVFGEGSLVELVALSSLMEGRWGDRKTHRRAWFLVCMSGRMFTYIHGITMRRVEVKWCVIRLISRAMLLTWCAALFWRPFPQSSRRGREARLCLCCEYLLLFVPKFPIVARLYQMKCVWTRQQFGHGTLHISFYTITLSI